jgi:ABC-type glycerol-3-phosphate transport system permease component
MRYSLRYRVFRYALVVVFALIMVVPLFYMVSRSFMTASEVQAFPAPLVPAAPHWQNYIDALSYLNPAIIGNTFIFAIGVVVVQLVLALPAAFALSKIPFKFTGLILGILVVPLFIPANFTLIPLFLEVYQFGWLNTYQGLIIPMAAQIAFAVLLFRQFFAGLPDGLIEAARIDGASWFRVFTAITLPLSRPVLATYVSVSFLTAWNMYIWPQVIATDQSLQVINVALAPLAGGQYSTASPAVGLAGAVIALIPVLAIFLIFQKWYVRGVVGTGLE